MGNEHAFPCSATVSVASSQASGEQSLHPVSYTHLDVYKRQALGIWLYGRTFGKTVIKTYLDPATHQEVVLKKSHTLFFIGPMPWACLLYTSRCV